MFQDRHDAGRELARHLQQYRDRDDVTVLALPRGGVPVGYEVAHELGVPFDVLLVRKLGVPGHEELAMGAIGPGGVRVLNEDVVQNLQISEWAIEQAVAAESQELKRRERLYRKGRPLLVLEDRIVIVVDDGLATGASMRAAVSALRQLKPRRIVVAVPVGAATSCQEMRADADEVICARTPASFQAVGQWYRNFEQTTDEEVHALLDPDHDWSPATMEPQHDSEVEVR